MVAISLYRGNLHRVPDVPRRWLMPTPKLSLKDFKSLLHRRSKALSRLRSSTPDPDPNPNPDPNQQAEAPKENPVLVEPKLEEEKAGDCEEAPPKNEENDQRGTGDGGDCSVKPVVVVDAPDLKPEKNDSGAVGADVDGEALPAETKRADLAIANPNSEVITFFFFLQRAFMIELELSVKIAFLQMIDIAGGDFWYEMCT